MEDIASPYDLYEEDAPVYEHLTIEEELAKFRQQWRTELLEEGIDDSIPNRASDDHESDNARTDQLKEPSIEEQAKYLFLQGVTAEQRGQLSAAIRYYRKAVQLVPDIEFKIDDIKPKQQQQRDRKERTISECSVESLGTAGDDEDLSDLLLHFHKLKVTDGPLCELQFPRPGVGFPSLPAEVLQYVLKWLVSSDLDVVALEKASLVCRGFYVACRDEELWRLICQRIWGLNAGDASNYGSYRLMYYNRPHLRFNGAYISKTIYYSQGENSFGSFYRPFHMVEYYRYLRFYPEGHVLMLTTADNPYEIIPKLKHKTCKCDGLLYGRYRVVGNVVSAVMRRRKVDYNQNNFGRYRRKVKIESPEVDETFHVEFELENVGSKRQSKLSWKHYSRHGKVRTTGEETSTEFHLSLNDYPPLIFSRVKSYTMVAEKPLC